jgi:ribonuclease-3
MSLDDLQSRIDYTFKSEDLLKEALTHPSYGHELRQPGPNNQRLEFLGDAVLQLAVTEWLYELFPNEPEGELSALRARLVNRGQLHKLAERFRLGEELILGKGEESNAGRTRASNLADVMEAILGAIFCDDGWPTARRLVHEWLEASAPELTLSSAQANPKGELQERLQMRGGEPPAYICHSESGPAHARQFEVSVQWDGQELGRGAGSSKKEAETRAAEDALKNWKN